MKDFELNIKYEQELKELYISDTGYEWSIYVNIVSKDDIIKSIKNYIDNIGEDK
jgi:hypothetical protein